MLSFLVSVSCALLIAGAILALGVRVGNVLAALRGDLAAAGLVGASQTDPQLAARLQGAELQLGQLQQNMEARFRTLSGQLAQAKHKARRNGPLLDDGDELELDRTPEQEAGIAQLMQSVAPPAAAVANGGSAPLRPLHRRR